MKIVQLNIEGFRSLKNVTWKPGDLNVIIGPNGSGKSNLLRMLEFIIAGSQAKLADHVQDEGGFESILWDGIANELSYQLEVSKTAEIFSVEDLSYFVRLTDDFLGMSVANETLTALKNDILLIKREGNKATIRYQGKSFEVPQENLKYDEPLLFSAANGLASDFKILYFQSQVTKWSVYQDIRFDRAAKVRQPPVSRLEKNVSSDGQNLINVLHTLYSSDRNFKHNFDAAMYAAFGDDYDELIFPPASDQRIQMRVRWKTLKREQSAADISDGTFRFLFLAAVLANPEPAPLIAIDQPETGLHPSMLPIIAELAVDAAERTQVVFTTHSDQFLDAFRETSKRPTTTVAQWRNGETTLTTLDDEELAYWLKEYSLGSLYRTGELENMAS